MGSVVKKIISPITSILGGAKTPAPPVIEAPTPAPVPEADDEQAKKNQRRRMSEISARSGRASTIMSNNYSGDKLGA